MIFDVNGSIITELGPYHLFGSELNVAGIVHHHVSLGFLRDEEYYLNVTFGTLAHMTMSGSYYFGIIKIKSIKLTVIAMHGYL